MYTELGKAATAGVYYRIADADCASLASVDLLSAGDTGWVGDATSTSLACATLCDAKQAYYKATGDRDTLPDVTAADDETGTTGGGSTYCFGYKWSPGSGADATCALG